MVDSSVNGYPVGAALPAQGFPVPAAPGIAAEGVSVGMPVYDPDDQIVEHQQMLADLLVGVGPGSWTAKHG